MTSIKPLSNSQKLFLQHFIVSLTLQPETSTHLSTTNSRREPDEDNGIDPTYMGNGFPWSQPSCSYYYSLHTSLSLLSQLRNSISLHESQWHHHHIFTMHLRGHLLRPLWESCTLDFAPPYSLARSSEVRARLKSSFSIRWWYGLEWRS